jgi:hypothetical protein
VSAAALENRSAPPVTAVVSAHAVGERRSLFGRSPESYHAARFRWGIAPQTPRIPGQPHGGRTMRTVQVSLLWPGLLIGAFAGAAGTTALNVIGYLDIAVRGRPASTTPERTVEALAGLFGFSVPGSGDTLANRLSGLGALTGYAAGIGMGLILGLAYALGWRPKLVLAVVVATALALIGTNGPMTVLGVTNPLTWGVVGWISDLIPHIGYGVVTAAVLYYLYPPGRPAALVPSRKTAEPS